MGQKAPPRPRRRRFLLCAALVVVALPSVSLLALRAFVVGSGPGRIAAGCRVRVLAESAARHRSGLGAVPLQDIETYVLADAAAGHDLSALPGLPGVYAVYDTTNTLRYIGLSRHVGRNIAEHVTALGPNDARSAIASVRALVLPDAPKDVLKATWQRWVTEHVEAGGMLPAGNLPEDDPAADLRWRGRSAPRPAASTTRNSPRARAQLMALGASGQLTSVAAAVDRIRETVQAHPVVLFMKGTPSLPQCGFSAKTVSILEKAGVSFLTVDVLDSVVNPYVREAVKVFSGWPTIPQLFVGGELLGGADIVSEMASRGHLQKALEGSAVSHDEVASNSSPENAFSPQRGEVNLIADSSRPVASKLCKLLNDCFDLYSLAVQDDSAAHALDAGAAEMGLTSESHFSVHITASEFEGQSLVQRQQLVFEALSEVMPRIHALSLVTQSPGEAGARSRAMLP